MGSVKSSKGGLWKENPFNSFYHIFLYLIRNVQLRVPGSLHFTN